VDDDQGLLRLLTVRLAAIGFAVTTCTTGEGALAIAHHESFDLAITDLYLPGQDGLAVMEELQRIHPSLPVLILTAHGSIPNAVEAMQKGAYCYLTKPFDNEALKTALQKALAQQQMHHETQQRMSTPRILIAPSGFKESLSTEEAAAAIAAGVRRACPEAEIVEVPLVDGGEGFTTTLVKVTGGTLHRLRVTGPVGEPVDSHFGILGGEGPRTAVLEMAAAAGLRLVPKDQRDPLVTTTYGVGELIKAALDAGAERILLGCGDSGTNDGGVGMAQALGVRLLDAAGHQLGWGGGQLAGLAHIDLSGRDPRLEQVRIDVACNWHNVLCGPKGVARVFGPQKGASPETVECLAAALEHYAAVIERDLGTAVRERPGSGASGGLGTGLLALLGATLYPRYEIVMQYLEIDQLLRDADLVFTAEGGLDYQTPHGKIPAEVAQRAKQAGVPVIALAGTIGKDARINYEYGIDAFFSIMREPCNLDHAITHASELLTACAENAMRTVMLSMKRGTAVAVGS
jgi:glycerate kinase